jgi:DNA (cytosine-5)-methyltransferase 1
MRLSDQVREETAAGRLLPTPEAKLSDAGPDFARAGREGSGGNDLVTALALLPTVTVQDGKNTGGPSQFERNTPPLNTAVLMLPTPRASDGDKGGPNQRGSKGDLTLPSAAVLLQTPSVADALGGHLTRGGDRAGEVLLPGQAQDMAVGWGEYEAAIRRWEAVMGPAPSPVVPGPRGGPRLSPMFTEWMMGQPAGWITDPAIGISRNEQIKACGNGVVTQQAVAALADMLEAEAAA